MQPMPAAVDAGDLVLRLALTMLAGLLIGYNRREHGKVAGLRTTVLVCLAASVAMIQVNVMLPTAGKPSDSYVTLDLMRLPLGILTGVGFIGGGAILRRNDLVIGVTTAATLWFVTVLGLCFGGGQIVLGLTALALGFLRLWGLAFIEERLEREHRADLTIETDAEGPSEESIQRRLARLGLKASSCHVTLSGRRRELAFVVSGRRPDTEMRTPEFLTDFARQPGGAPAGVEGPRLGGAGIAFGETAALESVDDDRRRPPCRAPSPRGPRGDPRPPRAVLLRARPGPREPRRGGRAGVPRPLPSRRRVGQQHRRIAGPSRPCSSGGLLARALAALRVVHALRPQPGDHLRRPRSGARPVELRGRR